MRNSRELQAKIPFMIKVADFIPHGASFNPTFASGQVERTAAGLRQLRAEAQRLGIATHYSDGALPLPAQRRQETPVRRELNRTAERLGIERPEIYADVHLESLIASAGAKRRKAERLASLITEAKRIGIERPECYSAPDLQGQIRDYWATNAGR